MTVEQLGHGWTPRRVGRQILLFPEVISTNSVALESAGRVDADGLVVFADYQSAGRGRQGRGWLSPRGASVLCSVLLICEQNAGGFLTLASAVAACDAIRQATDVTPAIKWPNDVRVGGKKLGGILIESRAIDGDRRAWVIGIGINCLQQAGHFPTELSETATSLEIVSSQPIDRVAVASALIRCLDERLAVMPAPPLRAGFGTPHASAGPRGDQALHQAWLAYAEPIGQRVRLRSEGREYAGRTVAVDPAGGLVVQSDDGTQSWFDPLLTTML